jgi:hypothetical protein
MLIQAVGFFYRVVVFQRALVDNIHNLIVLLVFTKLGLLSLSDWILPQNAKF